MGVERASIPSLLPSPYSSGLHIDALSALCAESANMLIMVLAHAQASGNGALIDQFVCLSIF